MTLHYSEAGNPEGETILFLHGAGMAGWSWQEVTAGLAQYHSIVIDLPGHGLSHDIQATSLVEMADICAEFIRTVFPSKKVHLVGLSLGGIITIEMLQHHADIIQSAVISGVNAIPLSTMTRMMVHASTFIMKTDFFIRQNAKMFQLDEEASQAYFDGMKQLDMTTMKAILPEIMAYEPADKIRQINIDIPCLFVAGGSEDSINIESVSILANSINDSVGTLAPNLHHGWSGEDPHLFADMVHQWIDSKSVAEGLQIVVDKRKEASLI